MLEPRILSSPRNWDVDTKILTDRMTKRLAFESPGIGDIIIQDGNIFRVAYIWDDLINGESPRFQAGSYSESYHLFDSGRMSYSGSLEPFEPLYGELIHVANAMVNCWFHSHDYREANNAARCCVPVKVWQENDTFVHDRYHLEWHPKVETGLSKLFKEFSGCELTKPLHYLVRNKNKPV